MKHGLSVVALIVVLVLAPPATSQAHFLWLGTSQHADKGKVRVVFGETADSGDAKLLDRVAKAEVWTIESRGEPKVVMLRNSGETLEGDLSQPATLILRHTFGVTRRGNESFLLKYYAKTYPFSLPGTWRAVKDNERLPLEIVPSLDATGIRLSVTWQGKPQAGVQVIVQGPGIDEKLEGVTDEHGNFRCKLPQAGTYSIRARHEDKVEGRLGEQDFQSVRHYSTLTLPYAPARLAAASHQLPALPKGTTSFGGAVAGDELFVYGGNYGSAHEYAYDDQSGDLWKLNLEKPERWEALPGGPRLQGLAMVEHQGSLYRVGGFTAMNKSGQPQDLRSQADFARFDPKKSKWEPLPNLSEPRSSHDAAVVGDTLYVVGGWNMQGGSKSARWHETALAWRFSAERPQWQPIAPAPFKRRAIALAAWQGKLYCIGGMQEQGAPTTAVAIYDPATNAWSEGPPLLGGPMEGFGCSAFASGEALYATTISGAIQRLAGDAKSWEFEGQLTQPRFFHRLLPWRTKLLVVGGASMEEGKLESLELLAPNAASIPAGSE